MKKLGRVPINDPCSLRAVSSLCPCELELVEFVEIRDNSSSSSGSGSGSGESAYDGEQKLAEELEIITKYWSTVRIFFFNIFAKSYS